MLKRLIEVALPLKEVSEQSAREKSIRHGHISTLHIWWARRPLAACRAVVFASLIPDPDDPECPESFRSLVNEILTESEFKPKNADGSPGKDTPRNRCLEYIKHLVKWENSNNQHYIEPARRLIAAAHKFLHPNAESDAPKVLDPFAGGGAIPLEALRLGCEAHAIDINPVAHLIQLCTLVYPQKYGQPNSRPMPDYIKRLIAHNSTQRKVKGQEAADLFSKDDAVDPTDDLIPEVEFTDAEYLKNPLAADVKYWGAWVLDKAKREIRQFYPDDSDGSVPVAYLWARTIKCPNPSCSAKVPLLLQSWLCKSPKRNVALKIVPLIKEKQCRFDIVESARFDVDPGDGTMQRGSATCPFCHQLATVEYIRGEAKAGRMSQQMTAVLSVKAKTKGKKYEAVSERQLAAFREAEKALAQLDTATLLPQEEISLTEPRRISPPIYGLDRFKELFNPRQALALAVLVSIVQATIRKLKELHPEDYANAVSSYLGLCVSRFADYNSSLCTLNNVGGRGVAHTFTRQSLPMVWDYAESMPFNDQGANWQACVDAAVGTVSKIQMKNTAVVLRGSATALPLSDGTCAGVFTDPPYYDAVPYSDLSDFFYVWIKRTLSDVHKDLFRTPLTPKQQEIVEQRPHRTLAKRKDATFYEQMMQKAFAEISRVLMNDGIAFVMFAHKSTTAWETLIAGLLRSGLTVTGSWPLHTEKPGRTNSQGTASLASSVSLVCRKRSLSSSYGLWDEVRKELKPVAKERLDFFWSQGIRGADFFISAIGPALSVFGKYERVTKLSGDEVSVGQFLDEVRSLVTAYALSKIMKTTQTANIDADSQFYVIWKWSYGEVKVPADESFKLAQALGMDTETMWDRTGILEKAGENVLAVPVAKRMKIKNLGEPKADTSPASIIDVLHRLCVFRDKNDTEGMTAFLARSGQGRNSNLWLVAQAVSEILPDGDKEKQLMQGLLNQRDQLEEAGRQGKLF